MSRCLPPGAAPSFLVFGCLAVALALTSCGRRPGEKEVYPTSGELFVAGEPAVGARIAFHPLQNDSQDQWPSGYPRAVVDVAGKFVMETYHPGDGCPAGDYIVLVTWPSALPGEAGSEEMETIDRLRGRYATRDASSLKAKVDPPKTELGRYELK